MRTFRITAAWMLGLGLLIGVGGWASGAPRGEEPLVTRVFYLTGMDTKEAVTLLRSQLQARQLAEIRDLKVVVLTEVAEKVDGAESLLRELDAVAKAVDPHDPIPDERRPAEAGVIRLFRIQALDTKTVVTVMRAIYGIREMTELTDRQVVSVRAAPVVLDAAEALLRELGVLAEVKTPDEG